MSGLATLRLFRLAEDCICLSEPGIPGIRGVNRAGEPDVPSSDTVFVKGTLKPGGSKVGGAGDESFLPGVPGVVAGGFDPWLSLSPLAVPGRDEDITAEADPGGTGLTFGWCGGSEEDAEPIAT